MSRFPRRKDDEGATLILVLVFVASFAIIVPALLTQASTNVSSISFTRDVAAASLDSEAAADQAINRLRNGNFSNVPGQPCFTEQVDPASATDSRGKNWMVLPGTGVTDTSTGRDVLVTCQASDETGFPTSILVPIGAQNRPGQALLTLSNSAASAGIISDKIGPLLIDGGVFSNSGVSVPNNNGSIDVTSAALYARGSCVGQITADPRMCNYTATNALGDDPGYVLPAFDTLVARTVPSCTTGVDVALLPGRYSDAVALSRLTNTCGAVVHFQPGTYSFDFPSSDPIWSVTNGYVIGGTIPTASGRTWALNGQDPQVPGACISPTEEPENGGVEFVFNAASRMEIGGGGKVELCGPFSETRPPIAIFGANATDGTAPVSLTVLKNNKNDGGSPFGTQNNIRVKDTTNLSTAVVPGRNENQRSASVVATMPTTGIPDDAQLVSATMRVTHRETPGGTVSGGGTFTNGPVTSLGLALLPNLRGGDNVPDPVTTPPVVTAAGTLTEELLDVTDILKQDFDALGFTGLEATYTATVALGTKATADIDAIILDLVYEVPGYRTTQNACGGSACVLIDANGSNPATQFYVQGTTYAPYSDLDITLNNVSAQVFRFGLISNKVRVNITGSSTFSEAVISVPAVNDVDGTEEYVSPGVHLQVYVCDDDGCPPPPADAPPGYVPPAGQGWVRGLSSLVILEDTVYPAPTDGQRPVRVKTWNHPR